MEDGLLRELVMMQALRLKLTRKNVKLLDRLTFHRVPGFSDADGRHRRDND